MSLTNTQQAAILARGNVVLSAGAGTGKTRTLVERCVSGLLDESAPASISEMLILTFTEAAATEMRQRIRARLEEELQRNPASEKWQEQLALFEQAHIGTLHSFCLKLVRQHFHELQLDPQLAVMPVEEARLVSEETLDEILQSHYVKDSAGSAAVRELISSHGRDGDRSVRRLVLKLHEYSQTLPDPSAWLRQQIEFFSCPTPSAWETWLLEKFAEWRDLWIGTFESEAHDHPVGQECLAALKGAPTTPNRETLGRLLGELEAACAKCPRNKTRLWLGPLADFRADAAFMRSLTTGSGNDPLVEDWDWVRPKMAALLDLTRTFSESFAQAKRETGLVDFHDLEQHALNLLWNRETGTPTPVALHWRKQLRYVFVDEYQDINAAQDQIVAALSREGADANRFLVGDVKQSIYRFRLANPRIFQGYIEAWRDEHSHSLPLVENFRTREKLLDFINSVFELLMRPEVGGISYDERARLVFGAPEERKPLSARAALQPCTELHLRLKSASAPADETDPALAEVADLEEASREARLVALRLKELKEHGPPVQDGSGFRPMRWSDTAILLRSPSGKTENYAREFARAGIPLCISRSNFYEGLEIKDIVSLLQILDNPVQDVPLLAVLRSPLGELDLEELAEIRLAAKGFYWFALNHWHEAGLVKEPCHNETSGPLEGKTVQKVHKFFERFHRWRRMAREGSLSKCLETVLAETHYDRWLLGQPRGRQRCANLERLLGLGRQFDQFQRQGLFRFLRFLEAQQEANSSPDTPEVSGEDAVRLMSIHQSKGLEFPVVVLADLGKTFNTSDLKQLVILDDYYGLCPQVRPPNSQTQYPSVSHWLARLRQHAEMLGDEVRLLYVAMTRARDRLILTGTISKSKFERLSGTTPPQSANLLTKAQSYADWLGLWLSQKVAPNLEHLAAGSNDLLSWTVHDDTALTLERDSEPAAPTASGQTCVADWKPMLARLKWTYPHQAATREPAKASVSALRRRALALEDDEPMHFPPMLPPPPSSVRYHRQRLSAAEIGSAHHTFLEHVSLDQTLTAESLGLERDRMVAAGLLEPEAGKALDMAALSAFWSSPVGGCIRSESPHVRRELAFTARFLARDLEPLFGIGKTYAGDEAVVVQGSADLAVLLPGEIWLLDFKTDRVPPDKLEARLEFHRAQLTLYAQALTAIYQRPVTRRWLHFLALRQTCDV